MRFTAYSDEGQRLGTVSFGQGRFDVEDLLPYQAVADLINERFAELKATGDYDDLERLIRATLESVRAETGVRFVRDPVDCDAPSVLLAQRGRTPTVRRAKVISGGTGEGMASLRVERRNPLWAESRLLFSSAPLVFIIPWSSGS